MHNARAFIIMQVHCTFLYQGNGRLGLTNSNIKQNEKYSFVNKFPQGPSQKPFISLRLLYFIGSGKLGGEGWGLELLPSPYFSQ